MFVEKSSMVPLCNELLNIKSFDKKLPVPMELVDLFIGCISGTINLPLLLGQNIQFRSSPNNFLKIAGPSRNFVS